MKKKNLKYYKKSIFNLPHGLVIKRELENTYNELKNLLKENRSKFANKEYYKPRIDKLFRVLREAF